MKRVIGLAFVAGCVTLAVVIGQRMSTDAMAVMIGVIFGVAASIPTSLLVVAATRPRRDGPRRPADEYRPPQGPATQIYVVTPGMAPGQQALDPPNGDSWSLPAGQLLANRPPRQFKIVGEDERWLDDSDW